MYYIHKEVFGLGITALIILNEELNDIMRIVNFCLVFKGSCLKQKNATFTPPNKFFFFFLVMNWIHISEI